MSNPLSPDSRNSSILPPGMGTPRGVLGMSVEDIALPSPGDLEKGSASSSSSPSSGPRTVTKRTWYGRKYTVTVYPTSDDGPEERPIMLYAPIYNGLAVGLSVFFIGNGISVLLIEWQLDQNFVRFALCAVIPLLLAVSMVGAILSLRSSIL